MTDEPTFDRESIIHLLQTAYESERLVVEFRRKDGEIQALDITDHVTELEKQ